MDGLAFQLLGYAVYAIAIAAVAYAILSKSKVRMLKLIVFAAAGALLFHLEGAGMLPVAGVVISEGVAFYYGNRKSNLFILASMLYFWIAAQQGAQIVPIVQSILIGLLCGIRIYSYKPARLNKSVEIRRDVFQAAAGVVIIALLYIFSMDAAMVVLTAIVLIGYILGNFTSTQRRAWLSRALMRFEREGVPFGYGAVWLALGTLLAISFVAGRRLIAFVLVAIFIGDSLATIAGTKFGRHALPYNRKKSVEGSVAYFAVTAAIAYFMIGIVALPLALVAAIAESLPPRVDDNFLVPLVLAIIIFAARSIL